MDARVREELELTLRSVPVDEVLAIARRRWASYERRHPKVKQPSREARIRDLAKGLRDHYESDPIYAVAGEYEWIAEQIAPEL